jgi:hypothetical protein
MAQALFSDPPPMVPSDTVGDLLGAADARLVQCADMLERQAMLGHSRLLDDETVTRVRALAGDLAGQLAPGDAAQALVLRDIIIGHRTMLTHLHALAIEWRLATALAARRGIDPVLSPLIRRRLDAGAVGDDAAATATALVAAGARLFEALRRMRLPFAELPGDLQRLALAIRGAVREDPAGFAATDVGQGRLALIDRVLGGLDGDAGLALGVDVAGVPLFLSALARASGMPRETVVLATAEDDAWRLALILRAAGLSRAVAAEQLLAIRPDADPLPFDRIDDAAGAAALLAQAGAMR